MLEGILKTKGLVGKFILSILKQGVDSEYIRHYDNIHLSMTFVIMDYKWIRLGNINPIILTYEK